MVLRAYLHLTLDLPFGLRTPTRIRVSLGGQGQIEGRGLIFRQIVFLRRSRWLVGQTAFVVVGVDDAVGCFGNTATYLTSA